jgi:hypothetical protein
MLNSQFVCGIEGQGQGGRLLAANISTFDPAIGLVKRHHGPFVITIAFGQTPRPSIIDALPVHYKHRRVEPPGVLTCVDLAGFNELVPQPVLLPKDVPATMSMNRKRSMSLSKQLDPVLYELSALFCANGARPANVTAAVDLNCSDLPPLVAAGSNIPDALDMDGGTRIKLARSGDALGLRFGHRAGTRGIRFRYVVPAVGSLLDEELFVAHSMTSKTFYHRAAFWRERLRRVAFPERVPCAENAVNTQLFVSVQ